MGLMVGILVGALTLGSALPHLFNAFGGIDWRIPLAAASCCGARRRAADRLRGRRAQPRAVAALRSARRARPRGATCRCASPTSAISATCGSSTRCGRGSACSCNASFALTMPAETRADRRQARGVRDRSRPARIGCDRRGLSRRPARAHDDHDRRDGDHRAAAPRRSACCSAAPAWRWSPCASSGASRIVADSAQFSASIAELVRSVRASARC